MNCKQYLSMIVFSVMAICFTLIGCSEGNYLYDEAQEVANGAWQYSDTKTYTFDIVDTTKVYHIYLAIDHSTEFAYQNLYLKLHTLFPTGNKLEQQVSFELADKLGQWYGECGSTNCELLVDLQKGAYFNQIGKHSITLEQFMRKDPIQGINGLAVKIEELEEVRKKK